MPTFDPRTHIFRDGQLIPKPGVRVGPESKPGSVRQSFFDVFYDCGPRVIRSAVEPRIVGGVGGARPEVGASPSLGALRDMQARALQLKDATERVKR